MAAGADPVIPTHREFTALLVAGALIALVLVAVVSLSRDQHHPPAQRLLWPAVGRNRVLHRQERG